ncbi:unnamed protein product [Darwinula stevensoni]|uniref:Glucose-methanol-choline oxidoreductase N-terminal domain-containing protein n=1 Tax=Darwinula stevensoni TaxID=69355 RepID=A0A7R8X314_9CRUS|nr:unnamed protein product [Darwinula stevensoni]CAG0883877.1 unnamed protein product [Darwinula stevensoni]
MIRRGMVRLDRSAGEDNGRGSGTLRDGGPRPRIPPVRRLRLHLFADFSSGPSRLGLERLDEYGIARSAVLRCNWPRGKVLGGSSVLNYMLYVRGNKKDYDIWEHLGNYGWGFKDVLYYFKKSEDNQNPYIARNKKYHGVGGYLTVMEPPWRSPLSVAFVEAGIEMGYENLDFNAHQQTGFMIPQGTIRRGARCSTAKAFLRPVRLRPNLDVSMRSFVHKVLIDNHKRAWAVKFEKDGNIRKVKARKEIILCAGAVGSPHILMVSGVGPRAHLEEHGIHVHSDLKVGYNLQDHIGIGGLTFLIKEPVALIQSRFENIPSILKYAMFGKGPLTVLGGIEGLAFINTKYANKSDDFPDVEFHFTSGTAASDGGRQIRRIHGLNNRVWHEYYKPIAFKDNWTAFPTLLRPKSHGVIKLRSRNPHDYPLIYPNYLTNPDDVARLVEGMKLVVVMSETKAFKRYGSKLYRKPFPGCEHIQLYTDAYWECIVRGYTETIYHPAGTAKMGPHWDKEAVVDPELRVYGIEGLRVADCSIMPIIVSGNTNAPVIMIGEKVADMVKATWGKHR